MAEVVVLGAGPAGLMAALEAARAGHTCTVLEASDRVGGMAASFEVAGQRVDYGSHRLHPATPGPLLELIGDLLGNDLQTRHRSGRIHLGGRWIGFPLRAGDMGRNLPPRLTAAMAADSVRRSTSALRSRPTTDRRSVNSRPVNSRSFDDAVTERFGPTVAVEFYGPYARKLYGVGPDELAAELADRRISAGSPADILRRLVTARRPEGRTFLYPRRGYGQIAERLAEAAVDAGATIRLETPATGIEICGDGVEVATEVGGHRGSTCLSTIPLTTLADLSEPPPPDPVSAAIDRLMTRAMVLVYLVLDQPRYTEFDAHYLPGLDTTVARISEPKNYRDGDDPVDRTVLCAEIPCWSGDELWSRPAGQLAELVVEDMARAGLPPLRVATSEVRRLPSVYPVYDLAGADDRAVIEAWTRSPGPLVTLGRQGLRVIDNLHHVLLMGQGAAGALDAEGRLDQAGWSTNLDRYATHTVED
ncbi:MAG: FAD-dependent oxidoreductase [Acidimicrobiales bacterium]